MALVNKTAIDGWMWASLLFIILINQCLYSIDWLRKILFMFSLFQFNQNWDRLNLSWQTVDLKLSVSST